MALTLVRHPRPLAAAGLCYGRTELEVAPDLAGDADDLLARLGHAERIVSSPLGRCLRLAELLGARLALPVAIDADWREMDFGSWEGRAWDDVPRPELDAWAADFTHARPHGGESVTMLLARVRRTVARCHSATGRTLVVTHAGPIRAALFAAGGGTAAWAREIPFGSVIELEFPRNTVRPQSRY